jgi:maltose-binding protein MalE
MSKKTMKVLGLILSLVLVIGVFAGCAKKEAGAPAQTSKLDPNKKVTLKVWHSFTGGEEESLKEATAQYTEKHPNVTFELLYTPSDSFKDKVTASLQTGDGPDLFFGAHDWVGPMATGGLIDPIDDYVQDVKADYIQSVYDIASLNGKHYGFPMSMEAVVLIYNKDMITKEPSTLSEMIQMAKDNTKDGKFGLAVDENNTFYNTYGFLTSFGGSALKEDGVTPNLDNQAFADYMNFMKKLINEDKVLPNGLDYGTAQSLFFDKKAAFWINGPWCFGDIDKAGINWGAMPFPKNDITGKDTSPFVGGKMAFLPKTAKEKDYAADFAKFLTGADMGKLFYDKAGTISANKNVVMDKWTAKLIADAAAKGVPMPVAPEMNQIWQPAKDALTAVINDGKDASASAKTANDQAVAAINQMKGN